MAVHAQNEMVSQVAAMTLFAPMSVGVVWIGWRTRLSWPEIGLLGWVMFSNFVVWNSVMLFGLANKNLANAIQTNAAHWVVYLLAGCFCTRLIQWIFGIGIWSKNRGEGAQLCEPNPKPLSILKLLMVAALVAVLMAAYRYSVQKAAVENQTIYTPFAISEFQVFSSQSKPIISALIGGILLGVHWTAVATILISNRLRSVGLLVWFPVLMVLRWGSNQIYWADPIMQFDSSQTAAALSPILVADFFRQVSNQPSWAQYGVEALSQLGLTLIAFVWLAWFGFRIGFKDGVAVEKGSPYPALPLLHSK